MPQINRASQEEPGGGTYKGGERHGAPEGDVALREGEEKHELPRHHEGREHPTVRGGLHHSEACSGENALCNARDRNVPRSEERCGREYLHDCHYAERELRAREPEHPTAKDGCCDG